MEENLKLPTELKERRSVLETELRNTVSAILSQEMEIGIKKLFNEYGLNGNLATISWEFHPESDDEGGTEWWPSYINLSLDGEEIEMEELKTKRKSEYSESIYDYTLDEDINELIHEWKDDLYESNIEKIEIKVGE